MDFANAMIIPVLAVLTTDDLDGIHGISLIYHHHDIFDTHPASPFVNRMMCTLPTLNGRYTIRDTKLRIEANGKIEESELEAHTFTDTLSHWFHIELPTEMNEYIEEYLSACHSSSTF